MKTGITWPEGKSFAFTIFDDTDFTTVENGAPIYQLLDHLGFRTTKSVWPLKGASTPLAGGATCEDPDYLAWVQMLKREGFEIALHNVAFHTSTRDDVRRGLNQFRNFFDTAPTIQVNHVGCRDSLYWGAARLSGFRRSIYHLLTRFQNRGISAGHLEDSDWFWGDLCKAHIKYVRNFVYSDINTLKMCPYMPYVDRQRPYVNYWFASSEGGDLETFNRMLSEAKQDRLEREGGACIMYTHFGASFYRDGKLNPRFEALMQRLSQKNGWFVPVSTLLDHIMSTRGAHDLTARERSRLEWRWLWHKIKSGGTS